MYLQFIIFGCLCVLVAGRSSDCVTPNGEKAKCVALLDCPVLRNALNNGDLSAGKFVEASACANGKLTVCCGTKATFAKEVKPVTATTEINKELQRKRRREYVIEKLLPKKSYCGMQHWDDYFHNNLQETGTEASVDEFPWLMIVDSTRRCTGFLISNRFFITTVLCYFYRDADESKMLVGVHHIKKKVSCVPTPYESDDCTDGTMEVYSEKVYDLGRRVVLAKLTKEIEFGEFIRPICLPFEDVECPKVGDTVMTSGWGEAGSSEVYVKIKKRSRQIIIRNEECYSKFLARESIDICTVPVENSNVTSCWGDEGGPIMYKYKNNWYASGILNAASDCTLGDRTSAIKITPDMTNRILDYIYADYCEDSKDKTIC